MNLFITGSEGFLGLHLRKRFPNAKGYDLKNGLDILDTETLKAHMEGAEVVVHLAAKVSVEESKRNPRDYIRNNVEGTMSVIEAAIANRVQRLVYASSAACYDYTSSPYALTKYMSEVLMKTYKDLIKTVSLRFFNIYGEGQNPAYAAAITAFNRGIDKGEVTIYGDGKQTRDFVYVEDIVHAIASATSSPLTTGCVIDVGTGIQTSVLQLVELMSKIKGKKTNVEFGPERTEVRHSRADTDDVRRFLGFEPSITLEEGLRKFII